MPAILTASPHKAMSAAIIVANASGELPSGSTPNAASRSRNAASLVARDTSFAIRSRGARAEERRVRLTAGRRDGRASDVAERFKPERDKPLAECRVPGVPRHLFCDPIDGI